MTRYIDADKLINALCDCTEETWGKGLGASWWAQSVKLKDNMVECINNQPTADVAEVKHGRWDASGRYKFVDETLAIRCSECGCSLHSEEYQKYHWNYCPNCGAKMDGKDDT